MDSAHDKTEATGGESRTVLLVDDDRDYLTSVRMHLESAGFSVVTAESVAEAKATMEQLRPDAAVIDLMLEEADGGFTLCHHLKRIDAALPVIMISAVQSETGLDFDASTDEERAWIRADAFLAKPIRFEQLDRELHRLLRE